MATSIDKFLSNSCLFNLKIVVICIYSGTNLLRKPIQARLVKGLVDVEPLALLYVKHFFTTDILNLGKPYSFISRFIKLSIVITRSFRFLEFSSVFDQYSFSFSNSLLITCSILRRPSSRF